NGKVGDIIKSTTQKEITVTANQLSSANSTVKGHSGNTVSAEEAMTEARQDEVNKSGQYDASTPEAEKKAEEQAANSQGAKDRQALLANVYGATYNYFAGSNVCSTSASYDASWATSSDAEIVDNYNLGKSDGLQWKADEEKKQNNGGGSTYGGETTIDKEFKDAETSKTETSPVPSVDNRTENNVTPTPVPTPEPTPTPTPTPVPGSNGGDIHIDDEFKDAKIDGDLIYVPKEITTNEGFSNEAPSNFAPVVEDVQTTESSYNYFTPDELDEIIKNMDDKELAELIAPESLEETNEMVKTK
ncbi:hypothetical protein EGW03_06990, partial [bacterium]|nr:hypothetical protein [bacterium]